MDLIQRETRPAELQELLRELPVPVVLHKFLLPRLADDLETERRRTARRPALPPQAGLARCGSLAAPLGFQLDGAGEQGQILTPALGVRADPEVGQAE